MLDFGIEQRFRDAAIFLHMDATADISPFQDRQGDVPAYGGRLRRTGTVRSGTSETETANSFV